jgi:hypothetical protein
MIVFREPMARMTVSLMLCWTLSSWEIRGQVSLLSCWYCASIHPTRQADARNYIVAGLIQLLTEIPAGKETIAKLYADFLVSLKLLLPKAKPLRAYGARLKSEHGLQKVLKKIEKMGSEEKGGGVTMP